MEEFVMEFRTLYKIKNEKYYYYFDAEKLEWLPTVSHNFGSLYRFKNEFSAVKDCFNNQVAFTRYVIQGLDNTINILKILYVCLKTGMQNYSTHVY